MKRRIICLVAAMCLMLSGCSWMDGNYLSVQPHREQLSGMVAALYRHRAALTAAGKKIHMSDDNFLRDAEKILSGEIAAALNQTPSDALKYLRKKLKEDA